MESMTTDQYLTGWLAVLVALLLLATVAWARIVTYDTTRPTAVRASGDTK